MASRYLFTGAALMVSTFLAGCDWVVMKPSGDIASQQADLIIFATVLMLLIIVPVIALTFLFAWRYRATNTKADYQPDWDHSTQLELLIWGAPLLIIIVLGMVTWTSTHLLDPYRPLQRLDAQRSLSEEANYLEIQVVAMDWKWLFIYPEQGIATVNELVTPVDVPVRFRISASTVMNSFYVPALAGQIYAMPGMETKLHAVVNRPVESVGFSANYSGAGFSDMRFAYRGVSQADFSSWVKKVQGSQASLNTERYLALEKPSERVAVQRYQSVEKDLFNRIVNMCVSPGAVCMDVMMAQDRARQHDAVMRQSALRNPDLCRTAQSDPTFKVALQNWKTSHANVQ
ncbi:MAG: ubiquinol oxidase subunit II [Burkholderiales bacterium]|jgi:cytochrome o ubiquinol oxidase subunit 2|nr:ubiquinol oxidase subunit II [Burkholderiales bacterium]